MWVGSVGEADNKRRLGELDGVERGRQRIAVQGQARRIVEGQGQEEWFETVDRQSGDVRSEDELIRTVLDFNVVEPRPTHKAVDVAIEGERERAKRRIQAVRRARVGVDKRGVVCQRPGQGIPDGIFRGDKTIHERSRAIERERNGSG